MSTTPGKKKIPNHSSRPFSTSSHLENAVLRFAKKIRLSN